jgi:hypothetical protein
MNKVRFAMTVFFLAVVLIAALGWRWTEVLPPAKEFYARMALGLVFVAGLGSMAVIWTADTRRRVQA